jgi:hypothetical protein
MFCGKTAKQEVSCHTLSETYLVFNHFEVPKEKVGIAVPNCFVQALFCVLNLDKLRKYRL